MPVDFEFMDHVAIRVRDLEISAKWYHDVLGLEVEFQWENAWLLKRSQTRIGLYVSQSATPVENAEDKLTLHHFAFFVTASQFIAAEVLLNAVGIPYEGPKDSGYFWSLFMTDPDGYRVELLTDHADSIARRP